MYLIWLRPDALAALCGYFRWDKAGLAILGHVSAGHVHIHNPLTTITDYFQDTIGTALSIAIMGYVDSIVAAKENASRFNHSISPNRELVALGAGNIAASAVSGSLVGYGSISASWRSFSAEWAPMTAQLDRGTQVHSPGWPTLTHVQAQRQRRRSIPHGITPHLGLHPLHHLLPPALALLPAQGHARMYRDHGGRRRSP
jgi:hypothetical protein